MTTLIYLLSIYFLDNDRWGEEVYDVIFRSKFVSHVSIYRLVTVLASSYRSSLFNLVGAHFSEVFSDCWCWRSRVAHPFPKLFTWQSGSQKAIEATICLWYIHWSRNTPIIILSVMSTVAKMHLSHSEEMFQQKLLNMRTLVVACQKARLSESSLAILRGKKEEKQLLWRSL